jgi:hypothetical protein
VPLKNYTWAIIARSLVKIWGKNQGTDIAIHPTEIPTITPININKPSSDRAWKEPPPNNTNTTQHNTQETLCFFSLVTIGESQISKCSMHFVSVLMNVIFFFWKLERFEYSFQIGLAVWVVWNHKPNRFISSQKN